MKKVIILDEIKLTEVTNEDFFKISNIKHFRNSDVLKYLNLKGFLIQDNKDTLGFVLLGEVFNKITKLQYWCLFNVHVNADLRNQKIGKVALREAHDFFKNKLNVKYYIVSLNNYLMFKMIEGEQGAGIVDFYCLMNKNYSVEEMKAEERGLESYLNSNPNNHADMIVSLDKDETEKVKLLFFK